MPPGFNKLRLVGTLSRQRPMPIMPIIVVKEKRHCSSPLAAKQVVQPVPRLVTTITEQRR